MIMMDELLFSMERSCSVAMRVCSNARTDKFDLEFVLKSFDVSSSWSSCVSSSSLF